MAVHSRKLSVSTRGRGFTDITAEVAAAVRACGVRHGLAHAFCRHTSAGLVLMENADPTARADLEAWFLRNVPDGDPRYSHDLEGPDDMPSHIRMVLSRTSETIPVVDGRLALGTWQGLYLWEHRTVPHTREVVITVLGEASA